MKKFLSGAIALAAVSLTVPASAADLAARPAYTKAPAIVAAGYDWSGFYIGINGGGAYSRSCWDLNNFQGAPVNPAIPEGCHDATGAVFGGQVGYRRQSGAWVFGIEGQGDWANLKGSSLSAPLALGFPVTNNSKIDAIGVVTGQVGYAWNNVLFYVKGGAMGVNAKYEGSASPNNVGLAFGAAPGAVFDQGSQTRWGGAVGAGIDFGITSNIVIGVDYIHGFLGGSNVNMTAVTPIIVPGGVNRTDYIHHDVDMITARLSYKFGGPIVAKY